MFFRLIARITLPLALAVLLSAALIGCNSGSTGSSTSIPSIPSGGGFRVVEVLVAAPGWWRHARGRLLGSGMPGGGSSGGGGLPGGLPRRR